MQCNSVILALGGNVAGGWGEPHATLERAVRELKNAGVSIEASSKLYRTQPLSVGRQPYYLNAVVVAKVAMAPASLLRLLKSIERRAGRRLAPPMRARPLDMDIVAFGGRRVGWPARRRQRGRVILPHPEMHARAFVLVPLFEVAPHWRHSVFGLQAKALLARLAPSIRAGVRQCLDFAVRPCQKGGC